MPKAYRQTIWERKGTGHDDLVCTIPEIVNSDISFQLMFGVTPCNKEDVKKQKKHHLNYAQDCPTYNVEPR